MAHGRKHAVVSLLRSLAGACAFAATAAQAVPYELVYTGTFNSTEALNLQSSASPTFFAGTTPFTIHALFDDSSPNLAPTFGGPFNGFRAYATTSATIDVLGAHYSIDSISTNPLAGITVAIFDQNSFMPGRYGIGLLADPVNDGAGVVGDFVTASPNFVVSALTPTVFGDYFGVGHGSGVCITGSAPACPHLFTPWVLHDSANVAWNLTLGNYEEDYPVAHTPGATVGPLNSAAILSAVPEPSTYALMLAGLLGIASLRRRIR
jgi:hypothetical protein